MPRAKKPSEPQTSYTLRPEQRTMLGLPTKAPEAVPLDQLPPERLLALVPDEARLRRIVDTYRPRKADPNQVGMGLAFGAINDANQLRLFRPPKPPVLAPTPPASEGSRPSTAPAPASKPRARKGK